MPGANAPATAVDEAEGDGGLFICKRHTSFRPKSELRGELDGESSLTVRLLSEGDDVVQGCSCGTPEVS